MVVELKNELELEASGGDVRGAYRWRGGTQGAGGGGGGEKGTAVERSERGRRDEPGEGWRDGKQDQVQTVSARKSNTNLNLHSRPRERH